MTDVRIVIAALLHAVDFAPLGNICFMTRDQDFATPMMELQERGFVVLVANDNRQPELDLAAKASWDFYALCSGGNYRSINVGRHEKNFEGIDQ